MSEIYLYENKLINVDTSTECFCKDVLLPKRKLTHFWKKEFPSILTVSGLENLEEMWKWMKFSPTIMYETP